MTDIGHPSKRRRRCVCATAEACFACGRCLEQHCVCGAVSLALCRESRACNCRVFPPSASRCRLCHGCRQTTRDSLSHCRCLVHQQLASDEKKTIANACHCFDDKHFRAQWTTPSEAKARRREIARVQRRGGIPSSKGLYTKKIVAPSVGVDEFGEECDEVSENEAVNAYEVKRTEAEELDDAIHAVYLERSHPVEDGHMPQGPLSWSSSQPFQQAISALPTRHTVPGKSRPGQVERLMQSVTAETVDRSLENVVFEQDREAALPSEALVDYLLLNASVKASRIPELIGSFDDTAATALGVVVEEYMKQLVLRSTREPLCALTKRSVQAFAATVLSDFNYPVYLEQCNLPPLAQISTEDIKQLAHDLSRLVYDEFLALQPASNGDEPPNHDQLIGYITDFVLSEIEGLKVSPTNETTESLAKVDLTSLEKLNALKLSQHTSKVTGQRVYKYDLSADVGEKHRATVALDGFESREAAEQSIQRMHHILGHQDKRLSEIENPPPKVEDPIITELFKQLAEQVRQSRSTQVSQSSGTPSSTNATTTTTNDAASTSTASQ